MNMLIEIINLEEALANAEFTRIGRRRGSCKQVVAIVTEPLVTAVLPYCYTSYITTESLLLYVTMVI